MKMTSRFAMVTAAGLLIGATVTSAKAADLGAGGAADLEERIAELEATAARKGNRVVSLQIYGQVNKALLIWDDGIDSDAYVVDNDQSGSRLGFQGSASIKPGWTAGYNIEFDYQDSASDKVNQNDDEGNANEFAIRKNELYIESEQLGRLTIGQGSTASDGSAEVVLGSSLSDSLVDPGAAFLVRGAGGLTLGNFANNLDGKSRDDRIRYDTPSIYGFIVSASWGDDDFWDVALRFKKEFNSIRIAAAIAYLEDETGANEFDQISGSVSVLHVPTGIYGAFAAGEKSFDDDDIGDADYWYAQLGIEKRFLPYGSTTIYAEYGQYNDFALAFDAGLNSSEATRWGFGINQKFDSAALEIYAKVNFWEFEANDEIGEESVNLDLEDQTFITIGSRIKF